MHYRGFNLRHPTSASPVMPSIPSKWIECTYTPTWLERLSGYKAASDFDIAPEIRIEQCGTISDNDLYQIARKEVDHYHQIPLVNRPVFLNFYIQGPVEQNEIFQPYINRYLTSN